MATKTSDNQVHTAVTKAVPRSACVFACPAGGVRFIPSGDESGHFEITAYDGGIAQHPYWGNLALDLEDMTCASARLPVLDSHFTDSRVGFTTEHKIEDRVAFTGQFLKNGKAQELRQDMQQGFPMQASLWPKPGRIDQVSDGATAEVNGRTLKGPGAIFRHVVIQEVSMCVFGALNNTRSTALAADDSELIEFDLMERDNPMSNQEKPALTLEVLKAENLALYQMVFAAGEGWGIQSEKERFAALQKVCGDDTVLLAECFAAGMTVAEALGKRNEKLTAELKAEREKNKATTLTLADPVSRATAEFKAQPAPRTEAQRNAAPFDEAAATDDQLKAHFEATADLRDQFLDVEDYLSFVHADRAGNVKILDRR